MSDEKTAIIAGAKITTAWAPPALFSLMGVSTWAEFSAALAALLTGLFILEFLWKKIIRPAAVWLGWMRAPRRRDNNKLE